MSKIFKGTIVILRAKTNSGIILLEDGTDTQRMKFSHIFNDGDNVEASFIDDNPLNEIQSLFLNSDMIYYGFVSYAYRNTAQIVSMYPMAASEIMYEPEQVEGSDNIIKNIELWHSQIIQIIDELKQTSEDDSETIKDEFLSKRIKKLTLFNNKLNKELISNSIINANQELIGILFYLDKHKKDLNKYKNIPITKKALKELPASENRSQFPELQTGTNVSFQITKAMGDNYIRAKNIQIIEDKSIDRIKVQSPSYGRIIVKDGECYFSKISRLLDVQVGQIFNVTVIKIVEFGAFVKTDSGCEGLIPIGELEDNYLENIEEAKLNIGDIILVISIIDNKGRFAFSRKRIKKINPEEFENFFSVDTDGIYFIYNIDENFEVHKLNENNLVELISCYKDRNTPIDIKYQIIDRLIEMDLGIKGVKQKELIIYKKEMLTELISKSTNEKNKKKYAYELMEIDYNYENLKAVLRKDDSYLESISLSDDNLALLDSYNTNNSIKELLE